MNDVAKPTHQQAEALLDTGRVFEARELYRQLCGLDPTDAEAHLMAGAIDGELGRIDDAVSNLKSAIRIKPDYADAYHTLGHLYQLQGAMQEANDCLLKAVKFDPDYPEAWLALSGVQGVLQDFPSAEMSSRKAIELDASLLAAHLNLGNALWSQGKTEESIPAYERAVALNPAEVQAWTRLGLAMVQMDEFGPAERALGKALALEPANREAQVALSKAYAGMDKAGEAIQLLRTILEKAPDFEEAWKLLIAVAADGELLTETLTFCQHLAEMHPNDANVWLNLGFLLEAEKRDAEAASSYHQAILLRPDWHDPWNRLGIVHTRGEHFDEAYRCFVKAMQYGADSALTHVGYATMARLRGFLEESEKHSRIALERQNDWVPAMIQHGKALSDLGRLDEAIDVFKRARLLEPDDAEVAVGLAEAHERKGEYDEAYRVIEPFLGPDDEVEPGIIGMYARLSGFLDARDKAAELIERRLDHGGLKGMEQMGLHFRAGDVYDALSRPDQAMGHYHRANALKGFSFDADSHRRFVDGLIAAFDGELLSRLEGAGAESGKPVFIVGMPRSGTSLVEQILASHKDVFGAGELNDMNLVADELGLDPRNPAGPVACLSSLAAGQVHQLAARYLEKIDAVSSGQRLVTDKMPNNFHWVGLIRLLFPQSRVIHVKRNPLASCLSCYFRDFNGVHEYAYGLEDLGAYYLDYERLMQHWRTLPGLSMLELDYEDLVGDTESVSRAMLEFCGLDWDEGVLRFYESSRLVTTASYKQVKRPIYKGALDHWKAYEPHLEPLLTALRHREA